MAMFECVCLACDRRFEFIEPESEDYTGEKVCPHCGNTNVMAFNLDSTFGLFGFIRGGT